MISPHPKSRVVETVIFGLLLLAGTTPLLQAQSGSPKSPKKEINPRAKTFDEQAISAINNKLAGIIIPSIEFRATILSDAIEFLRQEGRRLDPDPNPQTRGVNLFVKLPALSAVAPSPGPGVPSVTAGTDANTGPALTLAAPLPSASARITLTMSHIPLLAALKYVADQAGMKVKIEPFAVSLVPLNENTDTLSTAAFRVSPTFIGNITNGSGKNPLDQGATAPH